MQPRRRGWLILLLALLGLGPGPGTAWGDVALGDDAGGRGAAAGGVVIGSSGTTGTVGTSRTSWTAGGGDPSGGAGTPILALDRVRIGMRGYGLSVFRGRDIEPFAVEVLSVMRDSTPGHGAIWIRCTDPAMRQTGPVSGMSGSPVYLWDDDEPHRLGRGGRLIGAYAFGFFGSKDAIIGVQPIEVMRQIADRAVEGVEPSGGGPMPAPTDAGPLLRRLIRAARASGVAAGRTWRAEALARLYGPLDGTEAADSAAAARIPAPAGGVAQAMRLPLGLRSAALADALRPVLEPLGLLSICAGGAATGKVPAWIDAGSIRLEPGAVLSIPLASGDLDLAAAGTVTDVLPDGRVLAFGHGMGELGGRGQAAMPMATGYVHFVEPSLLGSFKFTGSARIQGALVRDESSGVVGRPDGHFGAAPVHVEVHMPGQPARVYDYEVVHDVTFTPLIAAIVVAESMAADQSPPLENTLRLRAELDFGAGRTLALDSLIPNGDPLGALVELVPPVGTMAINPFKSVMLQSMRVRLDVEPQVRLATILHGRLDQAELAPGDTVGITVKLQAYRSAPSEHRVELVLPDAIAEGQYDLTVCDAETYLKGLLANRPHLATSTTIDQLYGLIRRLTTVAADALYVMIDLPEAALAVGRQELPRLPSSRLALIATPTSTLATPYREWVETRQPMPFVTEGALKFKITVTKTLANR